MVGNLGKYVVLDIWTSNVRGEDTMNDRTLGSIVCAEGSLGKSGNTNRYGVKKMYSVLAFIG